MKPPIAEIAETRTPQIRIIMPRAKPAKPPNNTPRNPCVSPPATMKPRNDRIAKAIALNMPEIKPAIAPPIIPLATSPATIPPMKPPKNITDARINYAKNYGDNEPK